MKKILGNYKKLVCKKHGRYFVAEGKSFECPQCKKELENDKTERSKQQTLTEKSR